jgi:hypothetical protein
LASNQTLSNPPDLIGIIGDGGANIWGVSENAGVGGGLEFANYGSIEFDSYLGSPFTENIAEGQTLDLWAFGEYGNDIATSPTTADFIDTVSIGTDSVTATFEQTVTPQVPLDANLVDFEATFNTPGTYNVIGNSGVGPLDFLTVTVEAPSGIYFYTGSNWVQLTSEGGPYGTGPWTPPPPGTTGYVGEVPPGLSVSPPTVPSGGILSLSGADGTLVFAQGPWTLDGTASLDGVNVFGTVELADGSSIAAGAVTLNPSASVEVTTASLVTFVAGGNETLILGGPIPNAMSVTGFETGDTIDLPSVVANNFTFDTETNSLLLYHDDWGTGQPASYLGSLDLAGFAGADAIGLKSDDAGGTEITFGSPSPTPATLAALAKAAYDPGTTAYGYGIVSGFVDATDGFLAEAFLDDSQLVVAFRGTDPNNPVNLLYNLYADSSWSAGSPNGILQSSAAEAAQFVNSLRTNPAYQFDTITLTGHSLGGALAQLVGQAANLTAVGFDAPGAAQFSSSLAGALESAAKLNDGLPSRSDSNYRLEYDQISLHGQSIGTQYTVVNPNTNWDNWLHWLDNHSIDTLASQLAANAEAVQPPDTALNIALLLGGSAEFYVGNQIVQTISTAVDSISQIFDVDPAGASTIQLTGDSQSPDFAAISLPSFPAEGTSSLSGFNLSIEVGGTWQPDGIVEPDSSFALSSGVSGIQFAAFDGAGDSLPSPDGYVFGVQFASTGNFDGTLIATVACFAAGTGIATERGEVTVQHLRIGDRVRLADGGLAPIAWLGHRRVACRQHPRLNDVQPVRIAAHAFGLGRPHRDVQLSPDHAVFVDGMLIPARYLLNDATVRQEEVATVTYWHVELSQHGILLANGLPAESYLDTGNRGAFANGGPVVMAHADFARGVWQRAGCAPLVTEGPARDLVYRRLIAQALALGWRPIDAGGGASYWSPPEPAAHTLVASSSA